MHKQINLRRVNRRGHESEFFVVSTINVLEPRTGEYLDARRVDGLIVLDSIDVRIEASEPERHHKQTKRNRGW